MARTAFMVMLLNQNFHFGFITLNGIYLAPYKESYLAKTTRIESNVLSDSFILSLGVTVKGGVKPGHWGGVKVGQ